MEIVQPSKSKEELLAKLIELKLLTQRLLKALEISEQAHINQKRKLGTPYLDEHIYPITFELAEHFKSEIYIEDLLITALLHDVVEDSTLLSLDDIKNEFGNNIAHYVDLLTKKVADNTGEHARSEKIALHKKYVNLVEESGLIIPILVRIMDRINNSECMISYRGKPKFDEYIEDNELIFLPFAKKQNEYLANRLEEVILRAKKTKG